MKVIYDHQIFEGQAFGGISRYFRELISRVAASDSVDVSVYMGFHVNRYGIEKFRHLYSDFFGVHRVSLPKSGRLFKPLNRATLEPFFRWSSPDIYHPTYYSLLSPPSFKGPTVVTVYDMIHELFPKNFPESDTTSERKRAAVERADRVIAISNSTKQDLVRLFGVPPERVNVIHLANSLEYIGGEPLLREPFILYVGARAGYKNFATLLQAYANSSVLLRECKLVCFGGGRFSLEEEAAIREAGLVNQVIQFRGDDRILSNLYSHALVFVYPSLYEGFGIPILEAMRHGCPVLTARRGSLSEVGGEAVVHFEPDQPDDLRNRLEQIVGDEELRFKLSAAGREREHLFSWEKTCRQTIEVYRSLG